MDEAGTEPAGAVTHGVGVQHTADPEPQPEPEPERVHFSFTVSHIDDPPVLVAAPSDGSAPSDEDMASRSGPRSQEGMYTSSSPPSSDPHDPFHHPVQMPDPARYYDNDSEHLDRYDRHRDTYGSDGSNADDDRYYEHGGVYDYGLFLSSHASTVFFSLPLAAQPDTDSDLDVYGQKYVPSQESLGGPPRMGISESSTPTFVDHTGAVREPYPAWSAERQIPLSKEEIEDIFLDLTQKFGFQRDSMRNMVRVFHPSSLVQVLFPCIASHGSRANFFFPCINIGVAFTAEDTVKSVEETS